jgi:hypothetical protein
VFATSRFSPSVTNFNAPPATSGRPRGERDMEMSLTDGHDVTDFLRE